MSHTLFNAIDSCIGDQEAASSCSVSGHPDRGGMRDNNTADFYAGGYDRHTR
jgi:hypothetical protein